MFELTRDYIRKNVAFSDVIFQRGIKLYEYGSFACTEADPKKGAFVYDVDGNYGDYTTRVQLLADGLNSSCDCPYPGKGCKHTVAVLLDVFDRVNAWKSALPDKIEAEKPAETAFLLPDEIWDLALKDRRKRAKQETFKIVWGDMYKGEDVYSIVQFLDPHLLSPLWKFAADHFMLSRSKKGKILGYRNLDKLQEKLKPLVIRRKKEEVLTELPEVVENRWPPERSWRQPQTTSP